MSDYHESVVADPAWLGVLYRAGFPVLGVVAGAGLPGWALPWLLTVSWLPMPGPLQLLTWLRGPVAVGVGGLLGLAAGVGLAVSAVREQLTVHVSGHRVALIRGGTTTAFSRQQVHGVFRDGRQLVLLGPAGQELARESSELSGAALRRAFAEHGYRWYEEDPYSDEFRRWVPDLPGLPVGADALLRARQRALEKQDGKDAAQLRIELARLGVVVRDQDGHQFWRCHDATA